MTDPLPPTLWPVVFLSATGKSWPPETAEDADAFVLRAQWEQLLPLLCDAPALPAAVQEALTRVRNTSRTYVARAIVMTDRLRQFMQTMSGLGEEFIVLKGCDFRHRLYEQPHHRPVSDIDVLVRDGDMERVATLLAPAGLTRFYSGNLSVYSPSHHETALGFGTAVVDLHQRFGQMQRYRIDYRGVWQRAVPFKEDRSGLNALRLADADALAYLTISMTIKYLQPPLIAYVDLWRMLQANREALGDAADLACRWQARHAFYGALRRTTRLFPEFEGLVGNVRDRVLPIRRRRFLDRFVIPPGVTGQTAMSRFRQIWTKFWLMDNVVRRIGCTAEHARECIDGYRKTRGNTIRSSNDEISANGTA